MRRLVSRHAEYLGGQLVEPGAEFDESKADEAAVKRLTDEGKIREVAKPTKTTTTAKGGDNA